MVKHIWKNILKTIMERHFSEFEEVYEEKYPAHYGKFKLPLIP